ncbi:division/cell wall cluster transcriptional repressor MraZ [Pseudooceanicola onchidii]|uniref:division/cell wall cluster transcriptional repressor MraZ n=1 Tax=Pseudooceanicola onchidii TaxID=2562279 RepID=UPI0010A9DEE3|nr:cell division/cell wall cluster transcriptional repressor MraZ [Pseudooceanicola onchidii]
MGYTQRFQGSEDMKVDSKFRLSIPSDFRRVLESQDPDWKPGEQPRLVLLTSGRLDGYVEGYSIETIAEVQDALARKPKADPKFKALRAHYIHSAVQVTVDETGRIVVPAKVRDRLGLGKDEYVTFVGDLKTFQLWKRVDLEAEAAQYEDDLGEDFDPDAEMDALMFGDTEGAE